MTTPRLTLSAAGQDALERAKVQAIVDEVDAQHARVRARRDWWRADKEIPSGAGERVRRSRVRLAG